MPSPGPKGKPTSWITPGAVSAALGPVRAAGRSGGVHFVTFNLRTGNIMFKRPSAGAGFSPSHGASPSFSRPTTAPSLPSVTKPSAVSSAPVRSAHAPKSKPVLSAPAPKPPTSDLSPSLGRVSASPKPLAGSGGPPLSPPKAPLPFKDPEPPRRSGSIFGNSGMNKDNISSNTSSSSNRAARDAFADAPRREQAKFRNPEPQLRLNVAMSVPGGDGPGGDGDRTTCGRCKGAGALDAHKYNPGKGALVEDRRPVMMFEKKARSTRKVYNHLFPTTQDWESSSDDKQICRNCDGDGKSFF